MKIDGYKVSVDENDEIIDKIYVDKLCKMLTFKKDPYDEDVDTVINNLQCLIDIDFFVDDLKDISHIDPRFEAILDEMAELSRKLISITKEE